MAGRQFKQTRIALPTVEEWEELSRAFWENVKKRRGKNACWVWVGGGIPGSYGRVNGLALILRFRVIEAHRLSWVIHRGPIPVGMCVCHACDNKPCVRPDHLFLGTRSENMLDYWGKYRRGELAHNGKYIS